MLRMQRTFWWWGILTLALLISGCAPPSPSQQPTEEVDRLRQQQSEMAQELQSLREELARLKQADGDPVAMPSTGSLPPGTTQQDLTILTEPEAEGAKLYREAFLDFSAGHYAIAIAGFQAFIGAQPESPFVNSARYWLGHCYTGMGQPELAVQSFEQLIEEAPESKRAPTALVHLATLYQQLNMPDQVRRALDTLRFDYPDSSENRRIEQQGFQPALEATEGKNE